MIVGRGIRLMVPGDAPAGDAVVWFSSEDVTITGVEPIEWTHNVLPGAIASVHPARRRTEVVTDAGVEISALVTRQSERELELARGLSVFALIETGSVRVLER